MKRYALPITTGVLALLLTQMAILADPPVSYFLAILGMGLTLATIPLWGIV